MRFLEKFPFNIKAFRDLAGHHAHPDETIELNGRSQNNTRYRAFPVPNCFYQPFDMLVRRFISSGQRRNLVSTSKLSLLPHSIWSVTLSTNERKKKKKKHAPSSTLHREKRKIDLICCFARFT